MLPGLTISWPALEKGDYDTCVAIIQGLSEGAIIESFVRARLIIPSEGPGASSDCKLDEGRKGVKEALSANVGLSFVKDNLSVDNIQFGLIFVESWIIECVDI